MSIDRILSWFPSSWRVRYETEVRDLLEGERGVLNQPHGGGLGHQGCA